MAIKKFTHGDPDTDERLFCLVGKLALNPRLHDELGTAITSIPGDVWYLCMGGDGGNAVQGFCQVRPLKKGDWHLRFLYAENLGMKTRNGLIDRVIREARDAEAKAIYTNDRDTAGMWKLFGFVPGDKKRGAFVRWEKAL